MCAVQAPAPQVESHSTRGCLPMEVPSHLAQCVATLVRAPTAPLLLQWSRRHMCTFWCVFPSLGYSPACCNSRFGSHAAVPTQAVGAGDGRLVAVDSVPTTSQAAGCCVFSAQHDAQLPSWVVAVGAWDGGAVTLYWMSHWWLLRALRGLASSATTESLPAARAAVHRLQLACQCSLPRDESGLSAAARSLCVVAPTTAQRVSTHAFWLVAGLADGRAVLMDGEVYTSLDVSGSALKLSGVDAAAAQVRCSLSQASILCCAWLVFVCCAC